MSREILPTRRPNIITELYYNNILYTATIGFYEDGRVGEVFLACTKTGTDLNTNMRDSAIAVSFALQHGATVQSIREAMLRDEQGNPEGIMGMLLDLLDEQQTIMIAQVKEWSKEHERIIQSERESSERQSTETSDSNE